MTATARFAGSVARMAAPDLTQEVIELGGRWVTITTGPDGRVLCTAWGDDEAGEVAVGDPAAALRWLAGVLA